MPCTLSVCQGMLERKASSHQRHALDKMQHCRISLSNSKGFCAAQHLAEAAQCRSHVI